SLGAEVLAADNGLTAFEMLAGTRVNFLVTDIQMPKCDGLGLVKRIAAMAGHKPKIILMSGRSDLSDYQDGQDGICGCLYKPFSGKDLERVITQSLDRPSP